MILCLGTTPAVQRVMVFRKLTMDTVNRAHTTLEGASGKSINVAKVLHALGEQPLATGFLGGDRGEFIRQALDAQGVAHEFLTVVARTRVCLTAIEEAAGTHTELVEESSAVTDADVAALLAVAGRRMGSCRAAVLSGTLAPNLPSDFYAQLTHLAHAAGALAVVDAQGAALTEALAAQPDLVKPNRAELAATVGQVLRDEAAVRSAMRTLHARGAQRVVVTAGPKSVLAFDGVQFWSVAPPRVAAANPIGSGDAFTAGLVSRLIRGEDLGTACRWGAAAGAANALSLMPGELAYAEVERLVQQTKVSRAPAE